MTVKESIIKFGTSNGLLKAQAEEVFSDFIKDDEDNERLICERMNDNADEYPEMLIRSLCETYRLCVLSWLEKNHPTHFARTILERC
jgi:hypothetical protein